MNSWTPNHDATLRAYAAYAYDHEIAQMTGHCARTVRRRRASLGLPPYKGTRVAYSTLESLPGPSLLAIRAEIERERRAA
jgi:hypothetical protein